MIASSTNKAWNPPSQDANQRARLRRITSLHASLLATLVLAVAIPAQLLVIGRWIDALTGRAEEPEH